MFNTLLGVVMFFSIFAGAENTTPTSSDSPTTVITTSCRGYSNEEIGKVAEAYCFAQSLHDLTLSDLSRCNRIGSRDYNSFSMIQTCIKTMRTTVGAKSCLRYIEGSPSSFDNSIIRSCGQLARNPDLLEACLQSAATNNPGADKVLSCVTMPRVTIGSLGRCLRN